MSVHINKLACWILIVLILLPASVSANDSTVKLMDLDTKPIVTDQVFLDVGNHWAANAIYNMTQYGIINGYDESTFKPGNSITREEFAALLARSFSLEWNNGKRVSTYEDIQLNRWSAPYIEAVRGIYPILTAGKVSEFKPTTPVTREEFASALVQVLGYTAPERTDPSGLDSIFRDAGQIAEEYRNGVAAAVELKLVQGQSNRLFAPKASITRAEVASILYRAVLLTEEQTELNRQIYLPEQVAKNVFEVTGTVGAGAEVVLNGQRLEVVDGAFQAQLRVPEVGIYNIVIAVSPPSGKVQFVRKKVVYEQALPQISLYSFSGTATQNKITLSGRVVDEESSTQPQFYINDEKINVLSGGNFNMNVRLETGVNLFRFYAVTNDGRSAEIIKEILFTPLVPVLNVDSVPESTKSNTIKITGSVKDTNDEDVEVFVNGEKVKVDTLGAFSHQLNLISGKNTIVITAQNKYDKVSTIVKTIEFSIGK
jgi:acylphosphatase